MVEAAHVIIVQATSFFAMVSSLLAIIILGSSLPKFSQGIIKNALIYIFVQIIVLGLSHIFMLTYHIWDIEVTQDLWHIGAMVSLIIGVPITIYLIKVCKKFSNISIKKQPQRKSWS